jgi:preprotein translocase SecE subunit
VAEAKKRQIRKPRVRKAPTLREQAEIARSKTEKDQKAGKIRKASSKLGGSLKKTRITSNPLVKVLVRTGRVIKKVLRWITPNYFINSWREVRLVTWPTRRETWRLTAAVFVFAVVFGALVAGVDKVLDVIFKKIVLK